MTFSCHVCGRYRESDKIAVFSRVYPSADSGGATMSENIRYCADDPSCMSEALRTTLLETTKPPKPSLRERIRTRWFER